MYFTTPDTLSTSKKAQNRPGLLYTLSRMCTTFICSKLFGLYVQCVPRLFLSGFNMINSFTAVPIYSAEMRLQFKIQRLSQKPIFNFCHVQNQLNFLLVKSWQHLYNANGDSALPENVKVWTSYSYYTVTCECPVC